ncbi:MAG: PLP-dependent aminotransferase family protein [Anaerolineales bacterium]|nr:PLP-dependent aminotransferase family protein [Anaerolineales bacterium]
MPADKEPLYEQVANETALLIRSGTFRPGDRLPSVRKMSRQKKVSISTVLQAYIKLENRGLIEARPQSGYYVRRQEENESPEPNISSPQQDPCQVSIQELTMMVLRDITNPRLVQLGTALPNPDLLPSSRLARIVISLTRENPSLANTYDLPPGLEPLRVQIAQRLVENGCKVTPNDIVITSGCMEAIDLSLRATCRPGDIVAIESPIYFGMLQSLEALGLQVLEIPTHPRDGISLDALRFAIAHNSIRACMVISNFNNPLGSCIPDENKRQLVALLARHEIPLIENAISSEIHFSEQRPTVCKSYDLRGQVMLCSSFSKDLSPGYRVGWVVPGKAKAEVEWLKYTANIGVAPLPQMAIAQYLKTGGYDHHLRRIRREYAYNVGLMSQAVLHHFPSETRVTRPGGGFVLWVQLPEKVDSLELYKQALESGITLTPGYLFSASLQFRNFIRLNAACWTLDIERAIQTLGRLVDEMARS